MQVLRVRGFSLNSGAIRCSNLQQHGIGGRDFRGTGCEAVRFSPRFAVLPNLCRSDRDYTAMRSQPVWASSTLLSARLPVSRRLVLAAAEISGSDAQRPEKAKREVKKEWTRIPSTIYRPFCFPNVEEYARGLNSWQRILHAVGFLVVLAAVAWGRNLDVAGLVDATEPLFVEAARQMIVTGDYITPQFNSSPRFDKPVLMYWIMALSAKIFGDKVWAYRLPSCLVAMGLLVGLYLTVLKFGLRLSSELDGSVEEKFRASSEDNFLPAIITAAAFALNLGVMAWGSTALSDMLLTTNVGASLLSFFWGYAGRDYNPPKNQNHYLLSAAFLGLAFLSNGHMGILLPVCACGSFLLCTGDLKQVFTNELRVLQGVFIISLINLPWYGVMYLRHRAIFLNTFLDNFSIEQWVTGLIHQLGVRPWWFGLAAVLIMYFPWSLSLPSALMKANSWKDSGSRKVTTRSRKLVLFAAAWLVSGFGLSAFTASDLSSYLPVAPAIALLAASHLSLPPRSHENGVATGLIPALIYQILSGVFFLLPGMQHGSSPGMFAAIGGQLVSKHYNQIAFVILAAAGMLATRTEEYAVAYGSKHLYSDENDSGVVENSVAEKSLLPLWVLHTGAMVAMLVLFVTPCFRLVDSIRQAPVRHLALKAAQVQQPGEQLLMVGGKMPSVVYYSQLPTSFFDSFKEAADSLEKSSDNPESVMVISDEMWESSLQSSELWREEGYHLTRVILPRDRITAEQE